MKKIVVKLSGTDGNVFAIIGAVSGGLKRAGKVKEAMEFRAKALSSASYNAVLALAFDYVEVV